MPKIMSDYYPPEYKSTAFNCPYCSAYAKQTWEDCLQQAKEATDKYSADTLIPLEIDDNAVKLSLCSHCKKPTFWLVALKIPPPEISAVAHAAGIDTRPKWVAKIMYPATRTSPSANDDLDDGIKKIYNEAADIANRSPRAACALLRLAIQMLLKQLGETGDNINNDIKNLVAKELDPKIQQALDIVRVTGNHAVHPGEIDFDDTTDVQALFDLINVIADTLITQPKQIEAMFNRLPQKDKESIQKRDKRTE